MPTQAQYDEVQRLVTEGLADGNASSEETTAALQLASQYGLSALQLSAMASNAGQTISPNQISSLSSSLNAPLAQYSTAPTQPSSGGSGGLSVNPAAFVSDSGGSVVGGKFSVLDAVVPGLGTFANLIDSMDIFGGGGLKENWSDATPEEQGAAIVSDYNRQVAEARDTQNEDTEGSILFNDDVAQQVADALSNLGLDDMIGELDTPYANVFGDPTLSPDVTFPSEETIPDGYVRDAQGFLRDIETGGYWLLNGGNPVKTTPPLVPVEMPTTGDAGGGGGASNSGGGGGNGSPATDTSGVPNPEESWTYDAGNNVFVSNTNGDTYPAGDTTDVALEDGGVYTVRPDLNNDGSVIAEHVVDVNGNKVAQVGNEDGSAVLLPLPKPVANVTPTVDSGGLSVTVTPPFNGPLNTVGPLPAPAPTPTPEPAPETLITRTPTFTPEPTPTPTPADIDGGAPGSGGTGDGDGNGDGDGDGTGNGDGNGDGTGSNGLFGTSPTITAALFGDDLMKLTPVTGDIIKPMQFGRRQRRPTLFGDF